jgi:uncharacterized protein with HEPN domain
MRPRKVDLWKEWVMRILLEMKKTNFAVIRCIEIMGEAYES